jgi:uncharacterized membrane protein
VAAGLREPDVPADLRRYPVVTFWHVVMDLTFVGDVPTGHGHLRVPTWSTAGWRVGTAGLDGDDTGRLRALLAPR